MVMENFNIEDDSEDILARQPERQLVSAVMIRAILDLSCTIPSHEQRDARAWFDSESEDPFSFRFCCQILAISPESVIKLLDSGNVLEASHQVCLRSDNLKEVLSLWRANKNSELVPAITDKANAARYLADFFSEVNQAIDSLG